MIPAALYRYLPWWLDWRTKRAVALIHTSDSGADDGVRTQEMSAWFLDIEIHNGQLRLINAHDEKFEVPVDSLLTLEIR